MLRRFGGGGSGGEGADVPVPGPQGLEGDTGDEIEGVPRQHDAGDPGGVIGGWWWHGRYLSGHCL